MVRSTPLQVPIDETALHAFCVEKAVSELALFGSVLRADFGPHSDVDVLVGFLPGRRISLIDMCAMEADLSPLLGGRAVDLHTIADLHPKIRTRVLVEREVLYEAPSR